MVRRMRIFASVALATLAAVLFTGITGFSISNAQEEARRPRVSAESRLGTLINQNTLAIVSGNLNATYLSIAYDLSAVLDDGDNLRILPVVGKGGGQNIRDVRFLKGVDMGITQSILLNTMQRTKEIGSLQDKLVYIAKLFNEEMHLIVRADAGITSIEQLRGKTVNFSDIGSGTQLSTRDIFTRLAIPVTEVNMGQADAFEKLKSGEIAATILIAGKPAGAMARLRAADGFRILPVPYPKQLHDEYLPTTITGEDYPLLLETGQSVESVAVSAVLFAYNWPADSDRYRRIAKFVEAFFPRLADFHKRPRHPKWRETNLAAVLPGWTRFAPAEAWLRQHRAPPVADHGRFEQFSAARGPAAAAGVSADDREQLFQDFMKWNQTRNRRSDPAPGRDR